MNRTSPPLHQSKIYIYYRDSVILTLFVFALMFSLGGVQEGDEDGR